MTCNKVIWIIPPTHCAAAHSQRAGDTIYGKRKTRRSHLSMDGLSKTTLLKKKKKKKDSQAVLDLNTLPLFPRQDQHTFDSLAEMFISDSIWDQKCKWETLYHESGHVEYSNKDNYLWISPILALRAPLVSWLLGRNCLIIKTLCFLRTASSTTLIQVSLIVVCLHVELLHVTEKLSHCIIFDLWATRQLTNSHFWLISLLTVPFEAYLSARLCSAIRHTQSLRGFRKPGPSYDNMVCISGCEQLFTLHPIDSAPLRRDIYKSG